MHIQADPPKWSYPGAPDTPKYIEILEIPNEGSYLLGVAFELPYELYKS